MCKKSNATGFTFGVRLLIQPPQTGCLYRRPPYRASPPASQHPIPTPSLQASTDTRTHDGQLSVRWKIAPESAPARAMCTPRL